MELGANLLIVLSRSFLLIDFLLQGLKELFGGDATLFYDFLDVFFDDLDVGFVDICPL